MQQNSVRPILEKGCLICPQCGEGKMPTSRTCCWKCGVLFEEPFAVPPQAPISKAEETQPPIKTSSVRPVEKSNMIGGAKAASVSRNDWHNNWPTVVLKINLFLAFISGILAFFPLCRDGVETMYKYKFISDMDDFTQAISYISALLSPILLGIASSSEDLWGAYRTLFCVQLTQCFLGAGLLATYNEYCINGDFSAIAFFWICIVFTVLGLILTSVVMLKAKARRT